MRTYTKWTVEIFLLSLLTGCGGGGGGESTSLLSAKRDIKGTYELNKVLYLAGNSSGFSTYTTSRNTTMTGTLVVGPATWKEKIVGTDHLFGNISTTTTGTYSGQHSDGTATFTFSDGSKKIVQINYDSETRITIHYPMEYVIIPSFMITEKLNTWDKVNNVY